VAARNLSEDFDQARGKKVHQNPRDYRYPQYITLASFAHRTIVWRFSITTVQRRKRVRGYQAADRHPDAGGWYNRAHILWRRLRCGSIPHRTAAHR
jgi:hypothetical protein